MKRALVLVTIAGVALTARADDRWRFTAVPGADAGTTTFTSVPSLTGNQFMVSCPTYSGVTYRACPAADAGVAQCIATSTDAPIEAGKQVDLCMPSGYTGLSFFKAYDAGNPSCQVYLVSPKTVCQTP